MSAVTLHVISLFEISVENNFSSNKQKFESCCLSPISQNMSCLIEFGGERIGEPVTSGCVCLDKTLSDPHPSFPCHVEGMRRFMGSLGNFPYGTIYTQRDFSDGMKLYSFRFPSILANDPENIKQLKILADKNPCLY